MAKSFKRLLRSVDTFGHPIKVNYRGEESYKSALGGLMTLLVYSLTIVVVVRAIEEIAEMNEPKLIEYYKPMSHLDLKNALPLSLLDHRLLLVLLPTIYDIKNGKLTNSLPPEIG